MTTREEFITGLRQLADFLTVNPGIPTPEFPAEVLVHAPRGDDMESFGFVDRSALAMGVDPVEDRGHYKASLAFGPVGFAVIAITARRRADAVEERRLGREAFERQRAEAAANVVDGEVVEPLEIEEPRRSRGWLVDA